jgi:quercetin dioxygenase-like cupin family protein
MAENPVRFHGGDVASGGVFAIETRFPPGLALGAHRHDHGHLSILASGTARVQIGTDVFEMTGPCVVSIPPDTEHMVEAVTPLTWYCLWASDQVSMDDAREAVHVVDCGIRELPRA